MRTVFVIVLAALAAAAGLVIVQVAAAERVSWQQVYFGRAHGSDAFTSVVAAPDGGAYAAGYSAVSSANGSDMLLVRYAANGTTSWVRQWNGPLSGCDQCWDLGRDGRGGLYLAGLYGGTRGRRGNPSVLGRRPAHLVAPR